MSVERQLFYRRHSPCVSHAKKEMGCPAVIQAYDSLVSDGGSLIKEGHPSPLSGPELKAFNPLAQGQMLPDHREAESLLGFPAHAYFRQA